MRKGCEMAWVKYSGNPIIRPAAGTWKHDRCTSVTVAFVDETCYFYHDGGIGSWWKGMPGFNWVGLLTCAAGEFDGKTFEEFICNPILTHGAYDDMDRVGMISPRVEVIDGKFYLYYNAMSYESFVAGKCPTWLKQIGLAISDDAVSFEKVGREPIVKIPPGWGAANPKTFLRDGKWHMLTGQAPVDKSKGYAVYLDVSADPCRFEGPRECVFGPGEAGGWDSFSLACPTFYRDEEDGCYYLLYGASDKNWDYPAAYGLARSHDLRHWERHPDNPIIRRGEADEWDGGAIWITEFLKREGRWYAWYEGRSAGMDSGLEYSPGATKQIGLLTNDGKIW